MDDSSYMALAVELAERGVGWVSPNPLVGMQYLYGNT